MNTDQPDWLTIVREKVETLRYGMVQIVIHDSRVTQIERTEKTKIDRRETQSIPATSDFRRPDKLEES
jgi:hypothetical protein